MSYTVGSSAKITAVFRDDAGALYDPTTVVCTSRKPDGVKVIATPTRSALGNYYASVALDLPGRWVSHFDGQGPDGLGAIGTVAYAVEPSPL